MVVFCPSPQTTISTGSHCAMAFRAEDMGRFQFSDEDTEDLWDSPSKRKEKRAKPNIPSGDGTTTPEPKHAHDEGDTLFDRQESREAALRNELQSVRNINEVIEGLLGSLDRAKGNMDTVSRTVSSASTLLNTWTRILSQTEHNQRLILNPNWQGATQDMADVENEAALKQQAAERREQELQRQRETAARKAEEDARKRAQPPTTRSARGGTTGTRGRARSTGLARTPSVSSSSASRTTTTAAATRGSATSTTNSTRRPISGNLGRGIGVPRGRSRG